MSWSASLDIQVRQRFAEKAMNSFDIGKFGAFIIKKYRVESALDMKVSGTKMSPKSKMTMNIENLLVCSMLYKNQNSMRCYVTWALPYKLKWIINPDFHLLEKKVDTV